MDAFFYNNFLGYLSFLIYKSTAVIFYFKYKGNIYIIINIEKKFTVSLPYPRPLHLITYEQDKHFFISFTCTNYTLF